MLNGRQPFIPILRNRISTATGGDQQFYGGKPPFMAAMPPQVWQWTWADNTLYGRTDSDLKQKPMPNPLLFMLNGLKGKSGGLFHPAKAVLPAEGGTLYGVTDTDVKQPTMPKPTIFALNGLKALRGGLFHPVIPNPPETPGPSWKIEGITKDETGAAVGGFTVYLFNVISGTPILVDTTTSDGSGLYSFTVESGQSYWVVDYKAGTPDKAGASLNTLTGVFS
jgi:hypothetical protein